MKIKNIVSLSAALFLGLLFVGCEKKDSSEDVFAKSKAVENKSFTLNDLNGKIYEIEKTEKGLNFKSIKNKIVFLDFWATWCPPCRAEIPHLVKLQTKYESDFVIVGVLMEEGKSRDDVLEFVNDYGINYPITNSADNYKLARALGARGLPFMVMYDKEGNYFTHYVGAVPEEMIERDIKRALEQGKK